MCVAFDAYFYLTPFNFYFKDDYIHIRKIEVPETNRCPISGRDKFARFRDAEDTESEDEVDFDEKETPSMNAGKRHLYFCH